MNWSFTQHLTTIIFFNLRTSSILKLWMLWGNFNWKPLYILDMSRLKFLFRLWSTKSTKSLAFALKDNSNDIWSVTNRQVVWYLAKICIFKNRNKKLKRTLEGLFNKIKSNDGEPQYFPSLWQEACGGVVFCWEKRENVAKNWSIQLK